MHNKKREKTFLITDYEKLTQHSNSLTVFRNFEKITIKRKGRINETMQDIII